MANPEHVKILEQGVDVWNKWREDNLSIYPNLRGVDLSDKSLGRANFSLTDFYGTNFSRSYLADTDFSGANLSLSVFFRTNLMNSNLSLTNLSRAGFIWMDLYEVDFTKAHLWRTFFSEVTFIRTILSNAAFGKTSIVESNLSTALGLETVWHDGPSSIDYQTLTNSGNLPIEFLRGCGLPDELINFIPTLQGSPLQFYSSFISHSSKDKEFVEKLHSDLQGKGIRCWYAPEDLKIGDKIRHAIEGAIKVHDKLMIILSKDSIESQWVENEVEAALAREQKENRVLLFPIMLDKSVFDTDSPWAATIQRTRHIGDFTNWKDHDSYTKAFERLLRDLKKSEE